MGGNGLCAEPVEARLAALERRVAELESRRPMVGAVDGLGAPLDPVAWPALREAVKATIADIGVAEAAKLYGASPERFRSIVYRQAAPGLGARARLAVVIGGKRG
jgi:hypothetical protein